MQHGDIEAFACDNVGTRALEDLSEAEEGAEAAASGGFNRAEQNPSKWRLELVAISRA